MNTRVSVTELFSRDEIRELTQPSDIHGIWVVSSTWAVIGATFAGLALSWSYLPWWGKLLICIVAIAILAGRQLALAILMHDASHNSLFKTKWLNDNLVDWLCARPIWNDVHKYRAHHMRHHAKTSTPEDPDMSLVAGFPTTKKSIARKFIRDLTGITGLKFTIGRILMDAEVMKWTVANDVTWLPREDRKWYDYPAKFFKNSSKAIAVNVAMFGVLSAAGHPKLYLLWPLAYMTAFPLFIRIRSMAEHAGMQTSNSALTNTRTTKAGWIARTFVAPIRVNYHMEHHLMAAVPYFRLPQMHQMLRERGFVPEPPTYFQVIDLLSQGLISNENVAYLDDPKVTTQEQ
ncbi:MAG: fatty acid desaturase [Acinetobacter sp. 39-4]|nr:MAG: fatty acid desaturase [Acinetobacter sp. 39-4]